MKTGALFIGLLLTSQLGTINPDRGGVKGLGIIPSFKMPAVIPKQGQSEQNESRPIFLPDESVQKQRTFKNSA